MEPAPIPDLFGGILILIFAFLMISGILLEINERIQTWRHGGPRDYFGHWPERAEHVVDQRSHKTLYGPDSYLNSLEDDYQKDIKSNSG